MPFLDNNPLIGTFFNVTNSVGRAATNNRDDVGMVQWMLLFIYEANPERKPPGTMIVDRICGALTLSWIAKFQSDMGGQEGGFPGGFPDGVARPRLDGRVDRANGTGVSADFALGLHHFVAQQRPERIGSWRLGSNSGAIPDDAKSWPAA
jgi:hypothetical protein